MSEIKNVGYTWMAKSNQLTHLPIKGLTEYCMQIFLVTKMGWQSIHI